MIVIPLGVVIIMMTTYFNFSYFYLYPIFFYINYLLCNIIDPDNDLLGLTISEGITLRTTKRFYLGFFGALFVAYGFLYAYFIGLVGSHRSFFSHGFIVGTLGRMVFYNLPFLWFLWEFYNYGIHYWNWTLSIGLYESTKMEVWLLPYLSMQFLAWLIGDQIHLILDTEWAKGRLYTPTSDKTE